MANLATSWDHLQRLVVNLATMWHQLHWSQICPNFFVKSAQQVEMWRWQARGSQFGALMSGVGCELWQNLVAVVGRRSGKTWNTHASNQASRQPASPHGLGQPLKRPHSPLHYCNICGWTKTRLAQGLAGIWHSIPDFFQGLNLISVEFAFEMWCHRLDNQHCHQIQKQISLENSIENIYWLPSGHWLWRVEMTEKFDWSRYLPICRFSAIWVGA